MLGVDKSIDAGSASDLKKRLYKNMAKMKMAIVASIPLFFISVFMSLIVNSLNYFSQYVSTDT